MPDAAAACWRQWFAWQPLLALLLSLLAVPAEAQFPWPKAKSEPPAASAEPAEKPREKAARNLAEARRQQEAFRLEEGVPRPTEDPLVSERRRLLDRLVAAYGEQIKLLDDIDNLARPRPPDLQQQELLAAFGGPGPYPAVRVDALRDAQHAVRHLMQRLAAADRALDTLQTGQLDEQRKAAEAVRLAEDRLSRARGNEEKDRERDNRDTNLLRRKLAETQLLSIGLAKEKIASERKTLQARDSEIERLLARVLPAQELTRDDLEQQQALLRRELKQLNSEAERLLAENSRRTAERERLVAGTDAGRGSAQSAQRLQLLDARLESDRIRLLALNWAQTLAQASIDAWAQRYVGFQAQDAATRQTVVAWLSRNRDELENRRQLVQQLAQEARADLREQEARIDAGTAGPATAAQQAELLAALRERSVAFERVERMGTTLLRQLERWLADFGFRGDAAQHGDWKLAAAQVSETLKGIWNFEMFAVDESTIIDGKSVTVSYGVTVGKSIGALLLFLLGYWLFAALSRRLQRLMVQRFGVDQQLASVIRRWAMIALGVLLVVFILNVARIPLTVFAFLGGALAIGVGFGTQTIIKNVISGIIVLFERKIRVGDIIQLGGTTGHVVAVDLRASTVRGFDGVEALIPNSSFLENQVVNWTYSNPRIRREIRIGIAYGSPIHRAAEIIAGCAADHGEVLRDPPPEVFFEDFADSALLLVLVFWVELGPQRPPGRRVDSDLRYAIEKRLGTAGIAIPFPQRDLHLDTSRPIAVRITPPREVPGDSCGD
ncbi:mechanosensitive ion channel domain-containing protein [Accumulibacter sp.]|uniref:mechanosensitive ion channel domain-containing protein n=1 Tax=Accumulibacter sp. TaxID=2053492 RepID=UPI0025EDE5AB|nr:mechanosensitive ion channel domain-containing protein [Accumulibacter sp.]MCM8612736.1 mechanosensitive ion channel [Accumulibacter sp.]MCM8637642.1 mechanosensitive ion channel [Accumulibacter sp.]MCM8639669.1 mechanosensitive ion channel [Accumulibacter sp.]